MQCSVAVGRLLHLPLVGRCCFPGFTAFVGRVGGCRPSGCAVRAHNRQFALYKRFNGLLGCGWYIIPLAPVSRLNALYLRFNGLLSVRWYLIPHTTLRAVRRIVCRCCDNIYRQN